MDLSQLLEDSPLRLVTKQGAGGELYNERHRLALEVLLSGGPDQFLDFLRRESISNFLSNDEVQWIRSSAVQPSCPSLLGEDDQGLEQSLRSSADCSSVTYFPEVSDLEPPLLELGWPGFTAGSYRGATRAVAHFQPSYGECIYGCKEAARRMINGAKEVIAIVTDSLTDLDIFKDLQEACTRRDVPVYILLDQSSVAAFLQMCQSAGAHLDELQKMRVRTITGTTYYTRSGGRVTGQVHERFMLIDGIKVATGSYRFNWTDGKINSSNLVELSGQITEKFDEEFRVLYAQSLPLPQLAPPAVRHGGAHERLKHPLASSSPHTAGGRPAEAARLTSTPTRKPHAEAPPSTLTPGCCKPEAASKLCTAGGSSEEEKEEEEEEVEEVLAGSASHRLPPLQLPPEEPRDPPSCNASTQTGPSVTGGEAQPAAPPASATPSEEIPPTGSTLDELRDLSVERQRLYSSIRSKLEQTVARLSAQRELVDISGLAEGLRTLGGLRPQEPSPRLHVECGGGVRGT